MRYYFYFTRTLPPLPYLSINIVWIVIILTCLQVELEKRIVKVQKNEILVHITDWIESKRDVCLFFSFTIQNKIIEG